MITKLQWLIPKIIPSLEMQNKLMNMFESKKLYYMPFISRELEDYTINVASRDFTWKLGTKYNKIKYFIIGFQCDRENNYLNASRFDSCDLEEIFIELNSERYPYECLKCNFENFNAVQHIILLKNLRTVTMKQQKIVFFSMKMHTIIIIHYLYLTSQNRMTESLILVLTLQLEQLFSKVLR